MLMRITTILFVITLSAHLSYAAILSDWRGPNRDGKYPETNLMKNWPDAGPKMIWSYEGLGKGHGTVAIASGRLFVAGMPDSMGVLYAFDLGGKKLWQKTYGLEWTGNYPGVRSTPIIVDDLLYLESGHGVVYCFKTATGEIVWQVDLLKRFGAENICWGMAESVLIDGDRLICTPGGPEHNVVALNRFIGKTIWTAKGNGDQAAYCSPALFNHNGRKLIVTMTAQSIIGIDAADGRTRWRVEQTQSNNIHANTPVYFDGKIVCSSSSSRSPSHGLVLLQLSHDGESVKTLWRNTDFTNLMGGVIIKDGHLYGSKYRSKEWHCIDLSTGESKHTLKGLSSGVIVEADGLFYCYGDAGEIALVKANPQAFEIISSFEVPLGTDQHWAHPVIREGRMYIRHGDALMVYDISEKK